MHTKQFADVAGSAHASARHVRVTPMKARRMIDLIRGKNAAEATRIISVATRVLSGSACSATRCS